MVLLRWLFRLGWVSLAILTSCAQASVLQPAEPRCRAVLISNASGLEVKAMIESSLGLALDGGLVQASTPGGQVSLLEFDQSRTAYVGLITNPVSGTYRVTFRSAAMATKTLDVPVSVLAQSPEVVEVADGAGHSAFAAQTLATDQPISLGWSLSAGASVYVVTVAQGLVNLYSATTDTTSLLLPAGTFTATGSVSIRVTAQALEGDPLLVSSDFYSASQRTGGTFYFKLSTP